MPSSEVPRPIRRRDDVIGKLSGEEELGCICFLSQLYNTRAQCFVKVLGALARPPFVRLKGRLLMPLECPLLKAMSMV